MPPPAPPAFQLEQVQNEDLRKLFEPVPIRVVEMLHQAGLTSVTDLAEWVTQASDWSAAIGGNAATNLEKSRIRAAWKAAVKVSAKDDEELTEDSTLNPSIKLRISLL